MKNNFSFKSLMAVLLTVVMVLAMVVPAFALGSGTESDPYRPPYTIKINPNVGTNTEFANRFEAYAIFEGTFLGFVGDDENPEGVNAGKLTDIVWGNGVKVNEFVADLLSKNATLFDGAFTGLTSANNDYTDSAYAAQIANILAENVTDTNFVFNFAKVAMDHLNTRAAESTFKDGKWEVEVQKAGYYLLKDNYMDLKNASENKDLYPDEVVGGIVGVLGDQTVNMKSSTPTVDKEITNPGTPGNKEGATYEIGDEVDYQVTGTLPQNYDQFDSYRYVFKDTFTSGLTYVEGSLTVKIVNEYPDGTKETFVLKGLIDGYKDNENNPITGINWDPNTNTLTVSFDDLKKLEGMEDKDGNIIVIKEISKIVLEYSAEINSKAVIGEAGNPNSVVLEFDNDPFKEGEHGTTPPDSVNSYTFGLNILKVGDDNPSATTGLEGAKFVLSRQVTEEGSTTSVTKYAKFTTDAEGEVLVEWVATQGEATELVTDEDGKITVKGLDAGVEYTLTETEAPAKYNKVPDIKFTITATLDENGKLLTAVGSLVGTYTAAEMTDDNAMGDGYIGIKIIDPLAPILPGTGGAGIVMFYVIGGLLLASVAAFIIVSGRKRKNEQ